jgi:integrase
VTSYRRIPHLWRSSNGYLYIVYSDRGLWRRKSTKTIKLAAAQEQLREFIEQQGERRAGGGRKTLGQAAVEWVDARKVEGSASLKTLQAYALTAQRVSAAPLGRFQLGVIEPGDVRDYILHLRAKRLPAAALARDLLHVRMLFRWLQRQQLVKGNAAELVESPKAPRGRRPAVTPSQFEALRAAVLEDLLTAATTADRREAQLVSDLLEVLWHSGLRSIEAMRLEWTDVDLEGRTWMIRSPVNKGGEQRLPLHPDLIPILRRRQLETGIEAGPFVGHWHVRNAWRRFKTRHKEWAGWSLHSLRHGFVTRIRAASGDAAASHLARHKSKSMTEHYSHFDEETFRAALEGV